MQLGRFLGAATEKSGCAEISRGCIKKHTDATDFVHLLSLLVLYYYTKILNSIENPSTFTPYGSDCKRPVCL